MTTSIDSTRLDERAGRTRCPTCQCNWELSPPAKISNSNLVRCINCKAVYDDPATILSLIAEVREVRKVQGGPDRDSIRFAQQFVDMYRSGAQGAEMDCDAAQALALSIDDILHSCAAPPHRAVEAGPVGYVTRDDLKEIAEGRVGGHIFPAKTLRPENDVPLYLRPALPHGIEVKGLEWGRDHVNKEWHGNVPPLTGPGYLVKDDGRWCMHGVSRIWVMDQAGDVEAAKAAAQADYEARIRSALLAAPPAIEGDKTND